MSPDREEPEPTEAMELPTQAMELPTEAMELGDETRPVDAQPSTGPFAPATPPDDPISLVSPTAANMLLADALPPTAAPEPAVPDPTSGIDTLFEASRFHDYETAPPAPAPVAPPPAGPVRPPRPAALREQPHMTPVQRRLLALAGVLVALLALGALFFLGTRLPLAAARPTPSSTASPTPTPVPTTLPAGPVAPGSHRWDQLLGGECLASFPGPWAERYTVVDCATPHAAQLVLRARFADPATPGYPGAAALAQQLPALCSAPGVIDLTAAAPYTDAQLEGGYPATAAQWDAGDHWYYCFVSRSSGQQLTGSLAAAKPTPPAG